MKFLINLVNSIDMKINFFTLIFFVTFSLQAQLFPQAIKALENPEGESTEQGVYYKDFNNVFQTFEGTYRYAGTDFTFEMQLKKRSQSNANNYYWSDMIIGSYLYQNPARNIDVNYLNDMFGADALSNAMTMNIYARYIYEYDANSFCEDCQHTKFIMGVIKDPVSGNSAYIYLAKKNLAGESGLQIWIYRHIPSSMEGETSDHSLHIPLGNFFMNKIE